MWMTMSLSRKFKKMQKEMNLFASCSRRRFVLLMFIIVPVAIFSIFRIAKKCSLYNTLLRRSPIWKYNNKTYCTLPEWSKQIQSQPWYPLYISHVRKIDLSNSSEARAELNCARWWHPTPQRTYDELPDRGVGWKPNKKPPNYKRPKCEFGQRMIEKTTCGTAMEPLWKELEKLEIVYYPRDGSELGLVRESGYISSDGDMDIFVDMPQEKLYQALVNILKPPPFLSEKPEVVTRGVHWKIPGCPTVHIHFSDWTGVERRQVSNHEDTCACMLNSVPIACHKEGVQRMFTEYGPSWRVPLHSKHLDCVVDIYRFGKHNKKLEGMGNQGGIIKEWNVRELDRTVRYTEDEMTLILAHLNVVKATMDSKICYNGATC